MTLLIILQFESVALSSYGSIVAMSNPLIDVDTMVMTHI